MAKSKWQKGVEPILDRIKELEREAGRWCLYSTVAVLECAYMTAQREVQAEVLRLPYPKYTAIKPKKKKKTRIPRGNEK